MLKSYWVGGVGWGGVVGWGGGPCDYCVSPVQRIGFLGFLDLVWPLGQDLGPVGTGDWGLGLGLDNFLMISSLYLSYLVNCFLDACLYYWPFHNILTYNSLSLNSFRSYYIRPICRYLSQFVKNTTLLKDLNVFVTRRLGEVSRNIFVKS